MRAGLQATEGPRLAPADGSSGLLPPPPAAFPTDPGQRRRALGKEWRWATDSQALPNIPPITNDEVAALQAGPERVPQQKGAARENARLRWRVAELEGCWITASGLSSGRGSRSSS